MINDNLIYGGIILLFLVFIFIIIYSKKSVPIADINKCSNMNMYIDNSNKGGQFGRGVFANKNYKIGDIIEVGPLLVGNNDNMFIGLYKNYVWKDNKKILLLLGYASICNHSDNNNSDVIFYDTFYKLVAIKDIIKDEEITDTYCKNLTKEQCNNWFISKNIKKII